MKRLTPGITRLALSLALGGNLLLMAPALGHSEAGTNQFSDISASFWARPYIEELSQRGLISGYPDHTFRPDQSVSRAEFAALLAKSQGLIISPSNTSRFQDLSSRHWAKGAIAAVVKKGWLSGYPNAQFRPSNSISKVELAASLSKLTKQTRLTPAQAEQILAKYPDADKIPGWARVPMAGALQYNLLIPDDEFGQLNPIQPASRAQVSAAIARLLNPAMNAALGPSYPVDSLAGANIVGTLKKADKPDEWVLVRADGEQFFFMPTARQQKQAWFREGGEVRLLGNIDAPASSPHHKVIRVEYLQPLNPIPGKTPAISTLLNSQSKGKQLNVIGTLHQLQPISNKAPTGWILRVDPKQPGEPYKAPISQDYRILNPEAFKQGGLIQEGRQVTVTGSLVPQVTLPTGEGIAFLATAIQAVQLPLFEIAKKPLPHQPAPTQAKRHSKTTILPSKPAHSSVKPGKPIQVSGPIRHTVEVGGWKVQDSITGQSYVLQGLQKPAPEWLQPGMVVTVRGNVLKNSLSIYQEGSLLEVDRIEPVKTQQAQQPIQPEKPRTDTIQAFQTPKHPQTSLATPAAAFESNPANLSKAASELAFPEKPPGLHLVKAAASGTPHHAQIQHSEPRQSADILQPSPAISQPEALAIPSSTQPEKSNPLANTKKSVKHDNTPAKAHVAESVHQPAAKSKPQITHKKTDTEEKQAVQLKEIKPAEKQAARQPETAIAQTEDQHPAREKPLQIASIEANRPSSTPKNPMPTVQNREAVALYFPNLLNLVSDPETLLGEPATRPRKVIRDSSDPRKLVEALLQGPTVEERQQGFFLDEDLQALTVERIEPAPDGKLIVSLQAPADFRFEDDSIALRLQKQIALTLRQLAPEKGLPDIHLMVKGPQQKVFWSSP